MGARASCPLLFLPYYFCPLIFKEHRWNTLLQAGPNLKTVAVRPEATLDLNVVDTYVRARLPDADGPLEIVQFAGGHANLTYLVSFGSHEYVLRRPPSGPLAVGAYDMAREFRVLSALWPVFPTGFASVFFFVTTPASWARRSLSWNAEAAWSYIETCRLSISISQACIHASVKPLWTPWLTSTR